MDAHQPQRTLPLAQGIGSLPSQGGPLNTLFLLGALLLAGPDPVAVRAISLLPITVGTDRPGVRDGAQMLNAMLATRLSAQPTLRVMTSDELRELLAAQGERQQFGCEDDTCLAELAGAMGAELLATGRIVAEGGTLVWTESIVDAHSAQVVKAASVRGASIAELGAQAEELAQQLTGEAAPGALAGPAAQRRLGFVEAGGLAGFQEYRQANPGRTLSEALTQFVIQHNVESTQLAMLEAAAFGLAGVLVTALAVVSFGNLLAYNAVNPYLLLAGSLAALLLIPAAITSGLVGWGLAVVDALNIGRVPVKADGCCRDDADIREAQSRSGWRDAAALAIILAGPTTVVMVFLGSFIYFGGSAAQLAVGNLIPALRVDPQALFPAEVVIPAVLLWALTFWLGIPLALMPLLCGSPVGVLLLLAPGKAAVEEAPEDTSHPATKGAQP